MLSVEIRAQLVERFAFLGGLTETFTELHKLSVVDIVHCTWHCTSLPWLVEVAKILIPPPQWISWMPCGPYS